MALAVLLAWAAPPGSAQPSATGLPAGAVQQALAVARDAAAAVAPPAARIETEAGQLDPRLRLAPCARVQVLPSPGAPAWGRTRVAMRCIQGERAWQVHLPVTVRVLAPAWVATSILPAGTTLTAEQLQLADVDWASAAGAPFAGDALPQLLGRTLQRGLAAGGAPRAADLQQRRWFSAGELVRVSVQGSGFAVDAQGMALTDGLEGRPARVRTENGRVLTGVPVGDQRMQVML